ncbi:hypothetical protein ACFQ6N_30545 [Kitasatospora sp. NPDC056446]|uniref:hypothetical protein n=1 Tax=Kitasatospora sp. NPDC056446 TaxID=3345819 RepID=UPI0036893B70
MADDGRPITELAGAVRDLRTAMAAGTWRATRSDGDFAWTWRRWGNLAVTADALRHAMWIEGNNDRSGEVSMISARTIGLLLLPEADRLGQAEEVGVELVALAPELERCWP